MFLIYDSQTYPGDTAAQVKARQYVLITVDGGEFRAKYLEDDFLRAVVLGTTPKIPVTPCDRATFEGFLTRCGYEYGKPIPLLPVKAAGVAIDVDALAKSLVKAGISGATTDQVREIVTGALGALVLRPGK